MKYKGKLYIELSEYNKLKEENEKFKDGVEFLTNTNEALRACIKMTEKENEKLREEIKKLKNPDRVKFISYDGRYPNYCNGALLLNIDGNNVCLHDHLRIDTATGLWKVVDYEETNLPIELEDKIASIINDNLDEGHCGGCS
jgi:hypothetical protein